MRPVWLLLLLATSAIGAEPVSVPACELLSNFGKYSGKLVRVDARVEIEFESSWLTSPECDSANSRIWLEYGRGPRKQPAIWCCGSMVPRDSMKLIQDDTFKRFEQALLRHHSMRAVLSGRVDAARTTACANGQQGCCSGGFGHFGMACARFVIRRVESFEPVL